MVAAAVDSYQGRQSYIYVRIFNGKTMTQLVWIDDVGVMFRECRLVAREIISYVHAQGYMQMQSKHHDGLFTYLAWYYR